MSRSLVIFCAGALLLVATAGCTLDSFFLSFSGSSNRKEQSVALSVDQVSTSLQATLSKNFGLQVTKSQEGEEVHLKGETKQGKKFDFILQRQRSETGERTVIVFEGESEAEFLWLSAIGAVVNSLQTQQQPATTPDRSLGAPTTQNPYSGVSSGFSR